MKNLLEAYTTALLEEGEKPKSVYQFCKKIEIEEGEFYDHFSSFTSIEQEVFVHFHGEVVAILGKDEAFKKYNKQEILLAYYYTFFELLKNNRSLVKMILSTKSFNDLKLLRKHKKAFIDFTKQHEILAQIDLPIDQLQEFGDKATEELLYGHFLSILKYWLKDDSKGFGSTDQYIEKTTALGYNLIENSPINQIIDLGKFLFKEKLNSKYF